MKVNFSQKTYDVLKWTALILLPALAILYSSMSTVWSLPYSQEVTGTIAAIDVFLGVLLGVSSRGYNKNLENPIFLTNPKANVKVAWIMPTNTYDILKWIAQIFLPGFATFYYALALVWAFPEPDKVVTTIMAIDVFLGVIVGFSSSQYNKNASFVIPK